MEDWPIYPKICFIPEEPEENIPVEDHTKDAGIILENARLEAQKLLAETNNKIRIVEQEAYDRGFKKGEQDVWQSNKNAQEEYHKSTRKVLQQIKEIRMKIYQETEKELVELAVNIAEKLVHRKLELNPETILDIAIAACTQVKESELVIIYVEPNQIEFLKSRQDEIASQLYRTKRLEIIADHTIQSGGCRIETEQGYIDATIASMLKQLDAVIREEA